MLKMIRFGWLLLCAVPTAYAQLATLSGTLVDAKGATVPAAIVTVVNEGTGRRRVVTTSNDGGYVFSLLPLGSYTVTAQRQGFATIEVREVVLNVNDQRTLKLTLPVGQVHGAMTVAATPPLHTAAAGVGTLIQREFVENLPLNGRSFNALIELAPGAVLTKASGRDQGQFSVNGQRANANYYTVDGVSANVGVLAGFSLQQTAGGTIPGFSALGGTQALIALDALQEFRIQTSSYAPEFGRTPGAQVSLVTRAGTNQFHGTLFNYFRNDVLDANDWFANSRRLKKPALRQNDFGGVLGGPLSQRRHTYFFFSYEGLRLRQPQVGITPGPTLAVRQAAPSAIRPLLDALPLPNGKSLGEGWAEFAASYSNPASLNAASLRLDQHLGDKLTLFGRFHHAPSARTQRNAGEGSLSNLIDTRLNMMTLTFGSTQTITPRVSNDARFNLSRARAGIANRLDDFGGATPPPDAVFFPDFTTRRDAIFVLFLGSLDYVVGGDNARNRQRQLNLVDNLSLAAGTHQLKFGVDYRRLTPSLGPAQYGQNVFFDDLAQALANRPSFLSVAGLSSRELSFTNFSTYAQDTWQATRRLTLTYGLRWEVSTPPSARDGNDSYTVTGLNDLATLALAPRGTPLWLTTYDNFAPRVGAAYQLIAKPRWETTLRGGVGLFYDLGSGPAGNAYNQNNFPYLRSRNFTNTPFPLTTAQAAPPPFSLTPPYGEFLAFAPDLKLPRTWQWNLALEQSLGGPHTLTIAYVAAVGRRLLQHEFLARPNANFTNLRVVRNLGTSDYHALQAQWQRRLVRGWQALASYTWSHAIDLVSSEMIRVIPAARLDPRLERGAADFDVRHAFTAAVTYNLPALRASLLRDWSVDAFVRARTATPVNVSINRQLFGVSFGRSRPDTVAGVPLYLNDPTAAGGRRFNRAAFSIPAQARQGTAERNALRGFPVAQVDFALRRQFKLTERLRMQVRAEAFNLFNHANFGDPVGLLTSPQFGQSLQMLGRDLGGGATDGSFSPLYQIGGPRSVQLALKLQF
jgi:hypothetical protein